MQVIEIRVFEWIFYYFPDVSLIVYFQDTL
jgi:hypothetical protein